MESWLMKQTVNLLVQKSAGVMDLNGVVGSHLLTAGFAIVDCCHHLHCYCCCLESNHYVGHG